MDLIIPQGSDLFHGTSEEFPEKEIRPGGYDNLIWTADNSVIAQTYIPLSGGTTYAHADLIRLPSKLETIIAVQKLIGIDYDLQGVTWNHMDQPKSFKLPKDWDHIPEEEEVAQLLIEKGFELVNEYSRAFKIRSTYRELPNGNLVAQIHLPGEKLTGRLFIFKVIEPLLIFDATLGDEREGNLMAPDYNNLRLFEIIEEKGYDGIKINDFAQTEYWGNLGHTSIGLFERALKKLSWISIPAKNFDWDEATPINIKITPEYQNYLEG